MALIRLAWHWLGRWHEPLSVGASVALVGLVYLMPLGGRSAPAAGPRQHSVVSDAAQPPPADAQYYRDQWVREAAQYYALHPPRGEQRPISHNVAPPITTAKASFADARSSRGLVAQAAHVTPAVPSPPQAVAATHSLAVRPEGAAMEPPDWIQRWRVVASLAAGLLVGLAFASVWPASPIAVGADLSQVGDGHANAPGGSAAAKAPVEASPLAAATAPGELIAIRLPAAWVGVRPTSGETLRRAILAASYLIASLCGWNLLG